MSQAQQLAFRLARMRSRAHLINRALIMCAGLWLAPFALSAHELTTLPQIVQKTKPSVVGVGTFSAVRRPPYKLMGTGFVIGDGTLVATNAHVIPSSDELGKKEQLVVFIGSGRTPDTRKARVLANDEIHDLAILKIEGKPAPAVRFDSAPSVLEGTAIAFSGFPIGAVLGLYPVTHTGIVSAVTPVVIPARSARELTAAQINTLRDPFYVYQLDAVAYPGNSGSPLYRVSDGRVIGVINKVFVKSKKEHILSDPSAITYAIPINHLQSLLGTIR